jgi:uncharacterized protein (TIGR03435 family)
MKKRILRSLVLLAVTACAVFAQDITGAWQGTLNVPNNGPKLRVVVRISKDDAGALRGTFYSIDQSAQGIAATVTQQGGAVKVAISIAGVSFDGKLDSDGAFLAGTFTQGGAAMPLTLKHVTGDEIWTAAVAAPKPMPANADPEFAAASIKPSDPSKQGRVLTLRGSECITVNTPLSFLITFAYGIHARQLVGGPAWMDSDRYDLDAKLSDQGMPNTQQLKVMIQKLIADRFQLAFHRDKRELSVYALTAGKGAPKLTKSAGDPNGLPGLGFRGLGDMVVMNATMADFASTMQATVLDRPVVDQTNLQGKWDFTLKWTPDEFQFAGMGMTPPPPSDTSTAPDLFTAIQEQLGLKFVATKAQVEVFVVDKAEKPEN